MFLITNYSHQSLVSSDSVKFCATFGTLEKVPRMLCTLWYFIKVVGLPIFFCLYLIRLTYRRCNSKVCLVGKTALVTGGSRGIGLQTALGLAARGCKVIIACRSNAEKEVKKIIELTHNPNVFCKYLDLSSLSSVRKFAKEINESEKKLDILINNAGVGSLQTKHNEDGLNPVMATNYFGPFLLTHLLIDLLKKGENARIVWVSSIFMWLNDLTLDTLNYPNNGKLNDLLAINIYSNSKLGQYIVSNIFAEKLKPFGITSNAVHPGGVYTDLFESSSGASKIIVYFLVFLGKTIFKTPEEGAQPVLRLAVSNEYKNVTGTCAWDFSWMPAPKKSRDREFCRKIWDATENYAKLQANEKL